MVLKYLKYTRSNSPKNKDVQVHNKIITKTAENKENNITAYIGNQEEHILSGGESDEEEKVSKPHILKRGSEVSSYLNEIRHNSISAKDNTSVRNGAFETLNSKTKALVFKGEFYSIQRELYNMVEGDDKFKEIVRYTKLMDLPRRNELLEEYLSDETVISFFNPNEQMAINELLFKL